VAIALALWLPNLLWQATHGWPSLHFVATQNAKTASDTPPATYIGQQLLLGAGAIVAIVGVVWLWRRTHVRPLALVPVLVTVAFLVERGRAYYPMPADSIAIAAGVVAIGGWLDTRRRSARAAVLALVAVQAALVVLAAPLVLPVRSTGAMIAAGTWKDSFYKDEIGWPELADQAAAAWHDLPPRERPGTVIVAANYGEASALEHYGPARGLPPILSGHLSWQYWRPRHLSQRFALFVGYDAATLQRLCRSRQVLATIENSWHLDNEERGRTITSCRLRRPLGSLWKAEIASDEL
jgi:hypothetical protein